MRLRGGPSTSHYFLRRLFETVTIFEKKRENSYTTQSDYKERRRIKEPKHSFGRGHSKRYNQSTTSESSSDCLSTVTQGREESQQLHAQFRYWEQLQRIHPSHFEQEDADKRRDPLIVMMVREAYFKLQIKNETRTNN